MKVPQLFAVAALCGALAAPAIVRAQGEIAAADQSAAAAVSPRASYVDRGGRWGVERLGVAVDRRGLRAEQVRVVPPSGRAFHALVGAEAIVRVRDERALAALGLALVRALDARHGVFLVRDARGVDDGVALAARLAGSIGDVLEQAVPDLQLLRRRAFDVPPDDARYLGQWYLAKVRIERAWALSAGDANTTIAVVDDGCEETHPDLRAAVRPGRDVLDGDDDPSPLRDERGGNHGTACAGVALATGNNGMGIAGTCPQCTLRCVRLLGRRGEAIAISTDVEAYVWAREQGVAVASSSWGFTEAIAVPGPLATAIEALYDEGRGGLGAVVVFAAGNENREVNEDELYGVRGVIAVGALTNFDEATSFSNRGAPLDLTAPTGTLTTDLTGSAGDDPGDYTTLFGGTSSSCPVVAGVAGLVLSAKPTMRASEASELLLRTARRAPFAQPDAQGHDPLYGYGIVDPYTAVARALGREIPSEDAGTDASADANAGDGAVADAGSAAPPSGCACASRPGSGAGSGVAAAAALFGVWLASASARRRASRRERSIS